MIHNPNHARLLRLTFPTAVLAALAFGLSGWSQTSPQPATSQVDDQEEARYHFTQSCLICHGEEIVAGQRLTAKQWGAEVDKMVGWGSPLPADKKALVAGYLTHLYSDKTPKPAVAHISSDEALALDAPDPMGTVSVLPRGEATRGGVLFEQQCAKCHGPDAKGGDQGNNLVEKPVLLREADYLDLMRKGRRRMPGFANVLKPEQEADILAWLKGRRG